MRRIPLLTLLCLLLLPAGSWAAPIEETLAKLPAPIASYLTAKQLAKPGFHAKDGKGSLEVVAPEAGASPTYKISIGAKTGNPWESSMGWPTPEGVGPKKDDVLLVTFEARCTDEGKKPEGQVLAVLRRRIQPFNTAMRERCKFGRGWMRFNLVASPESDMVKEGIYFTFNLGLKKQNIEIRDLRVLNFGKTVGWARFLTTVGASRWRSGRRSVCRPLNPSLLWEMTAYADFVPTPSDFSPTGAWKATYAIFTCHGYLLYGTKNLGLLTLERIPGDDGTFTLKVNQQVRLDEAMLHVTDAEIHCRANELATPISWTLNSRFEDSEGRPIPDLDVVEEAKPADLVAGPATGDWCLFEAVQRLSGSAEIPEFALLEGLSAVKTGQRLTVRGEEQHRIVGVDRTFRRYDQIGHGVLPTNYWVDATGRLQVVVTHSRAYILEPEAEAKFETYSKDRLARYQRNLKRRQKEAK